jgi:sortase (surface protein transpeptidase)
MAKEDNTTDSTGKKSLLLDGIQPAGDNDSSAIEGVLTPPKSSDKMQVISRLMLVLALYIFIIGVGLSLRQLRENHIVIDKAKAAVAAANRGQPSPAPSTIPPTANQFASYSVAADLPRYLYIPKISVKAIVRQVGLTSSGAIGTPTNVFDTAWYNGSAKPGSPGAMVIDGHVSSWTSNGVFYNLKLLSSGDMIQIVRGDGLTLNYKVIKNVIYPSNNVDMAAVLSPVDATKPGLNLITCTGDVIKGTNDFDSRDVVYTEQV